MQPLVWSQLITLLLTVAVFVILIVVLTRNNLAATPGDDEPTKISKVDRKVNWLYGLAIAESGLLLLSMVIGLIFMMKWFAK